MVNDSTELLDFNDVFPTKYPKYLGKLGVFMRLPIIHWTDTEVFTFLGGSHNPLYDAGFDRVGCFPCLASGDEWKTKAFEFGLFGNLQYQKIKHLEKVFGRSVFTSKHVRRPSCALCAI